MEYLPGGNREDRSIRSQLAGCVNLKIQRPDFAVAERMEERVAVCSVSLALRTFEKTRLGDTSVVCLKCPPKLHLLNVDGVHAGMSCNPHLWVWLKVYDLNTESEQNKYELHRRRVAAIVASLSYAKAVKQTRLRTKRAA